MRTAGFIRHRCAEVVNVEGRAVGTIHCVRQYHTTSEICPEFNCSNENLEIVCQCKTPWVVIHQEGGGLVKALIPIVHIPEISVTSAWRESYLTYMNQ